MNVNKHGWEIWICDPRGYRIEMIDTASSFDMVLVANKVGAFNITLPSSFNTDLLTVDNIIEFWRSGQTRAKGRIFTGFMRKFKYFEKDNLNQITISGPDTMDLLSRRIVAYYKGESETDKTDYADDMMKEIVTENIGSGADDYSGSGTARDLSGYNFTVQEDTSSAPSITREFAWENMLDALQDIAGASETDGTDLYFTVRAIEQTDRTLGFEFRTHVNQIYWDRTQSAKNPLFFGTEYGNVENPILIYDYTEEVNYVYAGGEGEKAGRNIQVASDTDRINQSIWNRREAFVDARNEEDNDGVLAEAENYIAEEKPVITFQADILDTSQARFGVDWFFGDKITCGYIGRDFDGMINAMSVKVNNSGEENITVRIKVEE